MSVKTPCEAGVSAGMSVVPPKSHVLKPCWQTKELAERGGEPDDRITDELPERGHESADWKTNEIATWWTKELIDNDQPLYRVLLI